MEKLAIDGGKPVSDTLIPLAKPEFSENSKEDIHKILDSGFIRMGPYTKEFEERYADRVGAKYAYAVCNGTAALHTSFLSIIKPRDEVIAPAFTFFATASTVFASQGRAVFADVDADTFLIDVEDVKEKVTSRTRAIAPVHLFGNAADLKAISEVAEDHNLNVVSDAAQAHGTEYKGRDVGSYDDLNCYSFYPSKTLTTGEGGMVTTNNEELYLRGCLFRSHGEDSRYHHVVLGLNYRITDIAAAIGLNQLARLDEFLEGRRTAADRLLNGIKGIGCLRPQRITSDTESSYSYFSVALELEELRCTRDRFMETLKAENIDCAVHYPIPLTKQPIIKKLSVPKVCPVSEDLSERILSLPMHPYLIEPDIRNIIKGLEKVVSHYQK